MESILNVIINRIAGTNYNILKQDTDYAKMKIKCDRESAEYYYLNNPKIEFLFAICWFRSIILMIKYSGIYGTNIFYYSNTLLYNQWSPLQKWTCFINEYLFPYYMDVFEYHLACFLETDLKIAPTIKLLFPFFKYLCAQEFFTRTIPAFEIWNSPTDDPQSTETPEIIFVKYNAFHGQLKYTLNYKTNDYLLNGMILMNYNIFKLNHPFTHHYMYIKFYNNKWKSFESNYSGEFTDLNVSDDGSFTNSYLNGNLKYNIHKGSRLCMYVKQQHPIIKLGLNNIFYRFSRNMSV